LTSDPKPNVTDMGLHSDTNLNVKVKGNLP